MNACPLCGRTEGSELERVLYALIWERLEERVGGPIDDAVKDRHTPGQETALVECAECGLRYFAPATPGDASFYESLDRPGVYYESGRWEFDVVASLVRREGVVIDVGCGRGAFVRMVAPTVNRAIGLDHNAQAIDALRAEGFEAYTADVVSYAQAHPEEADAVCAFHLLEHVPRVGAVVDAARRALRPGGRLFASVPNRDRYVRDEIEPFDLPPHHLSRWRTDQFAELARRHDLELLSVRYEEPDHSGVVAYVRDRIRPPLARIVGGRLAVEMARAWTKVAWGPRRYRRAVEGHAFSRRGIYGHTMLAELRRPV